MTEGDNSIRSLKQQCAAAMAAFGLSIDGQASDKSSTSASDTGDDLLLLKQDRDSVTVRARCLENGVSKLFVLKYREAQDKIDSFALTTKLEELLVSEHYQIDLNDALAARPLIPRRKSRGCGQFFWLNDRPFWLSDLPLLLNVQSGRLNLDTKQIRDNGFWSISEYLANAPAFDWLEDNPAWTAGHARAAGELLAKLHCAGRLLKEKLTAAKSDQVTPVPLTGVDSNQLSSIFLTEAGKTPLASVLPSLPQALDAALLGAKNKQGEEHQPRSTGRRPHQSQSRSLNRQQYRLHGLSDTQTVATAEALSRAVAILTTGDNTALLAAEEIIVHGDFHPGNVLFEGTTALAAIDLDYAHFEHPLYDLAYALLMFAPTASTVDRATSFLAGYYQHFHQSAQQPPSFLPSAADVAALALGEISDTSPFQQYVVVAASLILLWTLSPSGSNHPRSQSLARRMVSLIIGRHEDRRCI